MSGRRPIAWTPAQLDRIRIRYATGDHVDSIAAEFAVSPSTICALLKNNGWRRAVPTTHGRSVPTRPVDNGNVLHNPGYAAAMQNCEAIKAYWRERGVAVDTIVNAAENGTLQIVARARDGVPLWAARRK